MDFTEKKLVEDYLFNKLIERGWQAIAADELERDSHREPLLIPNLSRAIKRINTDKNISDVEIKKALNEIILTVPGIEGSKKILNYYKFGIPVKLEKERVIKYIQLFDFDNLNNNEYLLTRQAYYEGKGRIRTDLLLYVNGIPLVNIECKNPASISESWYNAYRQIKEYEKTVPELFKYVQIGIAAESMAKYFPIVPWQEEVKTSEWKNPLDVINTDSYIRIDSLDLIIEMLSREVLLDIIKNFLFNRIEMGNATKVISRDIQYRAANKIVGRIINNLNGEEDKNKGLIWHWQGSGKTLTMIFSANKLYFLKLLENPSIFFIVDRIELEEQLFKEFNSLDIPRLEKIDSIAKLKEIISYDDYRGKRGIFIVLIHKFRPEEFYDLHKELEIISQAKDTIMNRKNVIAFIDEGHRTQYGILAIQMKNIFKKAFFFAFTGTPIAKLGKDTYFEFSYPPEELYLDRYFINESIRDGFTLKISYQPRLENNVHLNKELLNHFLDSGLEEIPEDINDIKEEVQYKVQKRLNEIKVILEHPKRIELISKDIVEHFKENIDGKFKAMVATGSRKACELYKQELLKYFPKEYLEVIITYGKEDEPILADAVREKIAHYGGKRIEDIRKEVIEKFKEEEYPKILIVTDMLLTGFDAPMLQVLYLDKPLKEHRLLQAVARTNRPYLDFKESGLVIDYVGILKEFERALENYNQEDIKSVLFSYDKLRDEFVELVKTLIETLIDVPIDFERRTLLKTIEIITTDKEREKSFVTDYKNLRKLYELLGAHEIKLEYLKIYSWLSAIYTYYLKVVLQQSEVEGLVQKYFDKTLKLIHENIVISNLDKEMPMISFDSQYLDKLEKKIESKEEKAVNILFTLNKMILIEKHRNPVYESLTEKVERLLKLWKEKTKDFTKIYNEGLKVFGEIQYLLRRQESLGFNDLEYAILITLEENLKSVLELDNSPLQGQVKDLSEKLKEYMFPGWSIQKTYRKSVEKEVRSYLRDIKVRYKLPYDDMETLHTKIMERIQQYGAV